MFKKTRIRFNSGVFASVAVVVAKFPYLNFRIVTYLMKLKKKLKWRKKNGLGWIFTSFNMRHHL